MNSLGQVVGFDGNGVEQPFVTIDGNVVLLADLHDNYQAEAFAINSAGLVVGWSYLGYRRAAVTWLGAGAPVEIAANFVLSAVNKAGDVFGNTDSSPAVWHEGILKMLPLYLPPAPATAQVAAYSINSSGQVAGQADVFIDRDDLVAHGVVWSGATVTDLGANTIAMGINDRGQVVGQSGADAALWDNGVLTDLGGLGGSASEAYAINNNGVVVGTARGDQNDQLYAVVWIDGLIHKLKDLTQSNGVLATFTSAKASAINDSGQILVWGAAGKSDIVLILTPSGIIPTAAAPTISLQARIYASSQTVTLANVTPHAVIYYTLDGTDPTSQSTVYQGPLTIRRTSILKAIAVAPGSKQSVISSAAYTIVAPSSASVPIDFSSVANVEAIGPRNPLLSATALDGLGNTYWGDLLGTSLVWSGIPFAFLSPNGFDGASGVEVSLPSEHFTSIKLLGTATRGNRSREAFVVTYMDGTYERFIQGMSDWATPQSYPGESSALTMDDRLGVYDVISYGPYTLYGYSFTLDSAKVVKSLKLPAQEYVAILAGTLVERVE